LSVNLMNSKSTIEIIGRIGLTKGLPVRAKRAITAEGYGL